jgi:hypothetical protein
MMIQNKKSVNRLFKQLQYYTTITDGHIHEFEVDVNVNGDGGKDGKPTKKID